MCYLETHMFGVTWTAWRQASELEDLHKRADRAMERSARDTIGDQRFDAAFHYFDHELAPKLRRAEEGADELSWGHAHVQRRRGSVAA